MVERAILVREADTRHLLTISAWNRAYFGIPGASIFDYWAPHSYEIYLIGPENLGACDVSTRPAVQGLAGPPSSGCGLRNSVSSRIRDFPSRCARSIAVYFSMQVSAGAWMNVLV